MPYKNMSKSKADFVLANILESGYPCVGVMLNALQSTNCDQGGEITTNDGSSENRPHGSFIDARSAGLLEIDRLMGDSDAEPGENYHNATLVEAQEFIDNMWQTTYGIVGLHSSSNSDLSDVIYQFAVNWGSGFEDAEIMRSTGETCQ